MASSLHNTKTSDRARASTNRCYELECSTEIAPRGHDAPVHTSESKGLFHTVRGMVSKAGAVILGGGESDETNDGCSDVEVRHSAPMTQSRQLSPTDQKSQEPAGRHVTAYQTWVQPSPVHVQGSGSTGLVTKLPGFLSLSALPTWFSSKKKDTTSDIRCPDRSPLESPQRLPQHSQRSHQTSTNRRRANTDLFECFDNLEHEATTFKVS